ncbi:MAG: hypothetical protein U5N55_08570 [Cypionkella sp.]|nr:hypothetical protein [Cypionkella sp.]
MLQRAMIAMALSCRPKSLIADEPTTALDVTIQAQILQLIKKVQAEFGMALIMITHDLGVVAETVDRVVVMYGGKRDGGRPGRGDLRRRPPPLHPRAFNPIPKRTARQAARRGDSRASRRTRSTRPSGCPFHPRCTVALADCATRSSEAPVGAGAAACWGLT